MVDFLFKLTKEDPTYLCFLEKSGYGDNISYQYLSYLAIVGTNYLAQLIKDLKLYYDSHKGLWFQHLY